MEFLKNHHSAIQTEIIDSVKDHKQMLKPLDEKLRNRMLKNPLSARFGSTYTKIVTIQRRLAWPLSEDDMQIREPFHIFIWGYMYTYS